MCKDFSNLTLDELNEVHNHLVSICQILNPDRKKLSTLSIEGLDCELKFELLAIDVFHELCKKQSIG